LKAISIAEVLALMARACKSNVQSNARFRELGMQFQIKRGFRAVRRS
jgi:hypothetical protein